ncbi:hypothetical protein GGR32_001713 [Mesonia hippocampi]|uniref:DUF4271 domain-containing protein n=1 Tax=Mesonia hippocampi TaxID=1628250 RepID=A0A840EQT5_9FLAO|nr:DUF4271 domain-containing protein [Mesonia hippocampi]MBB4119415.1 hypothetical protein [Mesonia hippocampi]
MELPLNAIERHVTANDWVTALILIAFTMLGIANYSYPNKFYDFVTIYVSKKYFSAYNKSTEIIDKFSLIVSIAVSLINALGIYIILYHFNITLNSNTASFTYFLQLYIILITLIGIKYVTERIISNLFEIDQTLNKYLFYKISVKNFISIAFFPIIIVLLYIFPPSNNMLIGLIIAVFSIHLTSLFSYYYKHRKIVYTYWFYFILYLCTLEIAPYFILYKVIILR